MFHVTIYIYVYIYTFSSSLNGSYFSIIRLLSSSSFHVAITIFTQLRMTSDWRLEVCSIPFRRCSIPERDDALPFIIARSQDYRHRYTVKTSAQAISELRAFQLPLRTWIWVIGSRCCHVINVHNVARTVARRAWEIDSIQGPVDLIPRRHPSR